MLLSCVFSVTNVLLGLGGGLRDRFAATGFFVTAGFSELCLVIGLFATRDGCSGVVGLFASRDGLCDVTGLSTSCDEGQADVDGLFASCNGLCKAIGLLALRDPGHGVVGLFGTCDRFCDVIGLMDSGDEFDDVTGLCAAFFGGIGPGKVRTGFVLTIGFFGGGFVGFFESCKLTLESF